MAASIRCVPCKFCGLFTQHAITKTARFCSSTSRKTWRSVVGLEIHAQIQTKSKLFSASSTKFGAHTNTQVSFFDAALPGSLPVLNRRCVEAGILTGIALNCHINRISQFDRKHYFYADLPAGYQITQHRQPLAVGGSVSYVKYNAARKTLEHRKARLTQIQLEQDSGKSLHNLDDKLSLIDLSRAGVGLMEIITEPELTDGEDAAAFVKELQMILRTLGTCNGKMAEGSLRVDANISVHHPGDPLGVRSEVKNINSIRAVSKAIDFEIKRQIYELEAGRKVINETRSFDADTGQTVAMRDKERLLDYRFMPEPNLPPLHVFTSDTIPNDVRMEDAIILDDIASSLTELPGNKRLRAKQEYGLTDISAMILVKEEGLFEYFEEILQDKKQNCQSTADVLCNELVGLLNQMSLSVNECVIVPARFGDLCCLFQDRVISLNTVRNVLPLMHDNPKTSPLDIVDTNGWRQIKDEITLKKICYKVLKDNEKVVLQYKSGKTKLFNKLIGRAQLEVGGRADPNSLDMVMKEVLS